jgi:hypothetical protein
LYIAKSGRLTKVGFSTDPGNRIYIANLEGYGGRSDWKIRAWLYSANAGRLERAVHQRLASFVEELEWSRNGARRPTREVFRCTYSQAAQAVRQLDPLGEALVEF